MKIVSEYLEKYWLQKSCQRFFFEWLIHTINMNSTKSIVKMFRYNKTLFKSIFKIKILGSILKKIKKSIKLKIK
jgi:hypothetical protein